LGPSVVIVTGGHGGGPQIVDVLFDGRELVELPTRRIESRSTHGTGCTFSAALAAFLAKGERVADAAVHAQAYVAGAIAHAQPLGKGCGPLDHFWNRASVY